MYNLYMKRLYLFTILLIIFSLFLPINIYAQTVSDLEDQVNEKNEEIKKQQEKLEEIKREIDSISKSSLSLNEKINLYDKEIRKINEITDGLEQGIKISEKDLKDREEKLLAKEKEISSISYALYKKNRIGVLDNLSLFFNEEGFLNNLFVSQILVKKISQEVKVLNQEYADIKSDKERLNSDINELNEQKKVINKSKDEVLAQKGILNAQINSMSSAKSKISGQINLLKKQVTDLQAAILLAKSGSASTNVSDVPATGDYNATLAGFLSKAPSGYFGVFSFGAYTHRNGMSQYGALARANAGQNVNQILSKYYKKTPVTRGTSGNIKTTAGEMDFETKYLYGIAEMPSSWPLEAQKAQAIAARTYAYTHYYNKTTICITESCQVWSESKYNNVKNGSAPLWKRAVDETKGMILSGVVTQYSATSGGYLNTTGWDTTDGLGGSGNWTSKAYESIAGSPWFYKSWYRSGYSDSSSNCGRMPWMSNEEMSDILNTYLVLKGIGLKGGYDSSKILPVTITSCSFGSVSSTPYSMSEMRNLINNPVTTIYGKPSVTNNSTGTTTNISFSTNRGVVSLTGADFKEVFNTRAPGYLAIPQNGFVFINIERK